MPEKIAAATRDLDYRQRDRKHGHCEGHKGTTLAGLETPFLVPRSGKAWRTHDYPRRTRMSKHPATNPTLTVFDEVDQVHRDPAMAEDDSSNTQL